MKKIIVLAAAIAFAAISGQAQQMPDLPNDPAVKVGKLDNGLTYYIRHNDKPAQRAEFYLATDAGAIQEGPGQDGLAHFLEHMCFNGTKNFPGKGILNWLESIGASFGGNVNASTGVEQTIYLLNNIPLIRPTVVDSCLLVMHDYSHFVLCEPEEIDAERGVILEEKRTRNTASWRIHEAMMPYLYGDTKYNGCNIIGSEETLKTFAPEKLTSFYHDWYRPDTQALIVVGDIDVDEVEAKIKSTFADIPAPVNPKEKEVIAIPSHEEPIIGIITDPEQGNLSWDVIWTSERMPEEYNSNQIGFVTRLLRNIINQVMNERLTDIAAQPNAPFLNGNEYSGKICEQNDLVEIETIFKEENMFDALERSLVEAKKLTLYGLTDAEIERAKANILSEAENAVNNAESRKNPEFVMPLIYNFLDNNSFLDPQTEYQMLQAILPQLNSNVVNQVAQSMITKENMVVLFIGNDKSAIPTEIGIKNIIQKVNEMEISFEGAEDIPEAFLNPAKLKGSKVKNSAAYAFDSEVITLKNGVKVYLRYSDLSKDNINIRLVKKGGESLISDEDLYSFENTLFRLYLNNTGVAEFPSTVVSKMLTGKNLSVNPFISNYIHGISADTTPKDAETALQLMYLMFTKPRFDADEYQLGVEQVKSIIPNLESQPNYQLQKQIFNTIFDSPRNFLISQEVLDKASLATLERVYKELFKDAAGADVYVTGDFQKEEIMPLIQKYIGSLPKGKKASEWKYRNDGIVNGTKVCDFKTTMQTPKVTVVQVYSEDKPFDYETEVAYDALKYVLDMIYVETLREAEGGTYGASVLAEMSRTPFEKEVLQIAFETNADSADKLIEIAKNELRKIAEEGPRAEMFDKTVMNLSKNIPEQRERASYWASVLREYNIYGTDRDNGYEAAVNALTPEKIQALASRLVSNGNFLEVIMRPQE